MRAPQLSRVAWLAVQPRPAYRAAAQGPVRAWVPHLHRVFAQLRGRQITGLACAGVFVVERGGADGGGATLAVQRLHAFGHLAQQVGVEHLACDRRSGRTAVTATFHCHRDRDHRVFDRREADEQRAVAQVHRQALRVHRGGALAADDLRGTSLASHHVRRTDRHAPAAAAGPHGRHHALAHRLHVAGVGADRLARAGRRRRPVAVETVALLDHQVRGAQLAVGQAADPARQLQRGDLPVALADADVDRITGVPGFLAALPLVGRRRQDATDLAGEVDAGRLAEAVVLHVMVEALDAQVQRQLVVVGVDRLGDGLAQVGPAVAATMRITPATAGAGQVEHAGGQHLVFRAAHARVQAGQADQRLQRGTGATPPSTRRLNCGRDGFSFSALKSAWEMPLTNRLGS